MNGMQNTKAVSEEPHINIMRLLQEVDLGVSQLTLLVDTIEGRDQPALEATLDKPMPSLADALNTEIPPRLSAIQQELFAIQNRLNSALLGKGNAGPARPERG